MFKKWPPAWYAYFVWSMHFWLSIFSSYSELIRSEQYRDEEYLCAILSLCNYAIVEDLHSYGITGPSHWYYEIMLQKYGWELVLQSQLLAAVCEGACLQSTDAFLGCCFLFSVAELYHPTAGLVAGVILLWKARSCPHAYWGCFLIQALYFPVSTSCFFIDTSVGEFVRWTFRYTDVLCVWREMPLALFVDIIIAFSKMLDFLIQSNLSVFCFIICGV